MWGEDRVNKASYIATTLPLNAPGSIRWKSQVSNNYPPHSWEPAIAIYDSLLFSPGDTGEFHALNCLSGEIVWSYKVDTNCFFSTPSIYGDTIYTLLSDGYLYALNLKGDLIWKTFLSASCQLNGSLAITKNGLICAYVNNNKRMLILINKDGSIRWGKSTVSNYWSAPVIDENSNIIFTEYRYSQENTYYQVFALDTNSREIWKSDSMKLPNGQGPVGQKNALGKYIYLAEEFRALDYAGNFKWFATTPIYHIYCSSIVLFDTIAIASTMYSGIYAFNHTGSLLWKLPLSFYTPYGTPCIGNKGIVYIELRNKLFAIDRNGNQKWSINEELFSGYANLTIKFNLLFVTNGKDIVAINVESDSLYNSSWPKAYCNQYNQSRIDSIPDNQTSINDFLSFKNNNKPLPRLSAKQNITLYDLLGRPINSKVPFNSRNNKHTGCFLIMQEAACFLFNVTFPTQLNYFIHVANASIF
jgi:outer membrane protein assembly factor BamB